MAEEQYATKTRCDRFFKKIGLPRTDLELTRPKRTVLIVSVTIFLAIGALLYSEVLETYSARMINAYLVFGGGALRFISHQQKHPRWQFLDLLGKMIAYYGAFLFIVTLAIGGAGS